MGVGGFCHGTCPCMHTRPFIHRRLLNDRRVPDAVCGRGGRAQDETRVCLGEARCGVRTPTEGPCECEPCELRGGAKRLRGAGAASAHCAPRVAAAGRLHVDRVTQRVLVGPRLTLPIGSVTFLV